MSKYNVVAEETRSVRDKSPHSKATVKNYVLNPVAVEVTQQTDPVFCCEQLSCKEEACYSTPKAKGFWQSLFGRKKCNSCMKNKSNCNCKPQTKKKMKNKKVQSNIEIKETCEEKTQLNCNEYNLPKQTQTSGNCLAKFPHPLAQRGCGCHLYFCIDKRPNKNQIRNKRAINRKNEKIKHSSKYEADCLEGSVFQRGGAKVTIFCEEPHKNMEKSQDVIPPNSSLIRNISKSKTNVYGQYVNEDRLRKNSFHRITSHYPTQRVQQVYQVKNEENDSSHPIRFLYATQQDEQVQVNNVENDDVVTPTQNVNEAQIKNDCLANDIIKNDFIDKNDSLNYEIKENSPIETDCIPGETKYYYTNHKTMDKNSKNNKIKQQENTYLTETQVYPVITNDPAESATQTIPKHTRRELSIGRTRDKVSFTESEGVANYGRINPVRGSLVRNSLMAIRKGRRQSQLEGGVNLILAKLEDIQGKIWELEKKYDEKENITMGIIGASDKQSNVAIQFYKEKDKEKTKFAVASKSTQIKPNDFILKGNLPEGKHNITRRKKKSKSQREINTVHKINISNINPTVSASHIHQSDANIIKINSKPFKCVNPKIVIEYPKKSQSSKSPIICDKWRRISEELKISQPNVTVRKQCYCTKCLL